jgi:carboxymethylenebutenolidase
MPNLHWRDAPGASPDDAAAASRAAGGVPDERLVGDVAGSIDYIKQRPGYNGKVGVVGHCSGGRQAFVAGCKLDVDAVVDCYGAFVVGSPPPQLGLRIGPVLDLTPALSAPLLGLFGAEDSYPNAEHVAELAAELDKHAKHYEFHTFDGAGHAFFSVDRPSYRVEAANQGWDLIFQFLHQPAARTLGEGRCRTPRRFCPGSGRGHHRGARLGAGGAESPEQQGDLSMGLRAGEERRIAWH